MPLRLDTRSPDFAAAFNALLAMKREVAEDVDQSVQTIIADVVARGDAALIDYSRKFDRVNLEKLGLQVGAADIDAAFARCPPDALDALHFAHARIIAFHERQLPQDLRFTDPLGV
ncbi:MAG: histidinol dehydrogenase, partial [Methylocella sp.]